MGRDGVDTVAQQNTCDDLPKYVPPTPKVVEDEEKEEIKHGYEEATPAPDVKKQDEEDKAKKYYGYEEASPSPSFHHQRTPRRSSMKQQGVPRRSSISYRGEVQNILPGQTKPVSRRTSISFKEKIRVKEVTPVRYLVDEPEQLWFQPEEYDRIRKKVVQLVRKEENGTHLQNSKKCCMRGLEGLLQDNLSRKSQARNNNWDSVLNEQYEQRNSNKYDDVDIGNVSKFSTLSNQREAANRAKQDAADVEAYLRKTRIMCRRMSM